MIQKLQEGIRGTFSRDPNDIAVSAVSNSPHPHAVSLEILRTHPMGPISAPRQEDRPGVGSCYIPVPQGVRLAKELAS